MLKSFPADNVEGYNVDWLRIVIPYERLYKAPKEKWRISERNQPRPSSYVNPECITLYRDVMLFMSHFTYGLNNYQQLATRKLGLTWTIGKGLLRYPVGFKHSGYNVSFIPLDNSHMNLAGVLKDKEENKLRMYQTRTMYNTPIPDDILGMGVQLEITGSGLRALEDKLKHINKDINWFCKEFRKNFSTARITRIDVNRDIFNGSRNITPTSILNSLKRRQVVCSSSVAKSVSEYRIKTGSNIGETLYIGTDGVKQLKIYDKKAERIRKHGEKWLEDTDTTWIRWEYKLADKYAEYAFDKLCNGHTPKVVFHNLLIGHVKVVTRKEVEAYDKGDIERKEDMKPTQWWYKFSKCNDSRYTATTGLTAGTKYGLWDQKMRFLERNVSRTFSECLIVMLLLEGDVKSYLTHLLSEGKKRMSSKDKKHLMALLDDKQEKMQKENRKLVERFKNDNDPTVLYDEEIDKIRAELEEFSDV